MFKNFEHKMLVDVRKEERNDVVRYDQFIDKDVCNMIRRCFRRREKPSELRVAICDYYDRSVLASSFW